MTIRTRTSSGAAASTLDNAFVYKHSSYPAVRKSSLQYRLSVTPAHNSTTSHHNRPQAANITPSQGHYPTVNNGGISNFGMVNVGRLNGGIVNVGKVNGGIVKVGKVKGGMVNVGGLEIGGFEKGGLDDGGLEKGGFEKGGFEKDGFEKGGFEKGGFEKGGFEKGGLEKGGSEKGEFGGFPTGDTGAGVGTVDGFTGTGFGPVTRMGLGSATGGLTGWVMMLKMRVATRARERR
ncbi:MAG: hypothetical protein Q9209_005258 [Squamulea sp. 1 TL-2023]